MRVSIFAGENVIIVDGKGMAFNCESFRSRQIKSIQWYGKRGEIEFVGGSLTPIGEIGTQWPDGWSLQGCIDRAKAFDKYRGQ
jgi:hypothetical protein